VVIQRAGGHPRCPGDVLDGGRCETACAEQLAARRDESGPDLPTEQAQEAAVQARRGMSGADALADYAEVSKPALDKLAEIAALDIEVPLGDLGTYPAAVLPTAYGFDHYTHIRADLFPPRGSLAGEPPASDELRIGSALDWITAALPQQNAAAAGACTLEIVVTGTGSRSIRFGHGQARATIRSDAGLPWSAGLPSAARGPTSASRSLATRRRWRSVGR
jgi:hypothetical protein